MKLSIEIEDVTDRREWTTAIRKLFTALADQFGYEDADSLWILRGRERDLKIEGRFVGAVCSLSPKERALLLAYLEGKYSKRGLGIALAAKDGAKAKSVTRQIRRLFSQHPEACRVISEAPPELRQHLKLTVPRHRVTKPRP